MGVRLSFGALFTAIVLFLWGWFYWGVLPTKFSVWKPLPAEQESAIVNLLNESLPENGVYMFPLPYADGADADRVKKWQEQHAAGPLFSVVYRREGIEQQEMGKIMGMGFAHMYFSALLCGLLLSFAGISNYFGRVGFVFLIGIFSALWIDVGGAIWWHQPLDFVAFDAAYQAVAWLLGGLVLAAIVRKRPSADAS